MIEKEVLTAPLLSEEEVKQWKDDGYIIVREVLLPQEIEGLLGFARGLRDNLKKEKNLVFSEALREAGNQTDLCLGSALTLLPNLAFLIDHPRIFGRILKLMGPHIYVSGSELLWRSPNSSAAHLLHTDGGPSLARIFPSSESIALSLKVQIFLTDVSVPGRGNMVVVPGSHKKVFPSSLEEFRRAEKQSLEILAKPGDAVLFPWSIWHGAGRNSSENSRVSLVLRYSQLWHRPVESINLATEHADRLTQRQRMLFGDLGSNPHPGDFYRPVAPNYLSTMLGNEWAAHPELSTYVDYERFSALLYSSHKA